MDDVVLGWVFVERTLHDGSDVPEDGKVLRQENVSVERALLRASEGPADALMSARSNMLCRTEHSGTIVRQDSKIASTDTKILWRMDASDVLECFARQTVLEGLALHQIPDILVKYLETGNEDIRFEAHRGADDLERIAKAAKLIAGKGFLGGDAWDIAQFTAGVSRWIGRNSDEQFALASGQNKTLAKMIEAARTN